MNACMYVFVVTTCIKFNFVLSNNKTWTSKTWLIFKNCRCSQPLPRHLWQCPPGRIRDTRGTEWFWPECICMGNVWKEYKVRMTISAQMSVMQSPAAVTRWCSNCSDLGVFYVQQGGRMGSASPHSATHADRLTVHKEGFKTHTQTRLHFKLESLSGLSCPRVSQKRNW